MAKTIVPKKLLSDLEKAVVQKSNAVTLLKDLRFRVMQNKNPNFFSNILCYETTTMLKDNPKSFILDVDAFHFISTAISNLDDENPSFSLIESFLYDYIPYMADNRPLIDYSSFNSQIRGLLKEPSFVSSMAQNITAISAQPLYGLRGLITITYSSNNNARDRNQQNLERLLEKISGFMPYFEDVRTEGVRVYATVDWLPSMKTFKTCAGEELENFFEAYEVYRDLGKEIDEDDLLSGMIDNLHFEELDQVDEYTFERFLNLVSNPKRENIISLSDVSDKFSGQGICRAYTVKGNINDDIVNYASLYLKGMKVEKRALSGDLVLTISRVSETILDKVLGKKIQSMGLSKFMEVLKD